LKLKIINQSININLLTKINLVEKKGKLFFLIYIDPEDMLSRKQLTENKLSLFTRRKIMIRKTILKIATIAIISFSMLTPTFAQMKSDIVDTAVAAGSFNTLVAAVQAAGLVDTLKSDGPFTVFAPTDAAFAALPAGTVENLLKPENKGTLVKILTYHVLSGKVMSADIAGKTLSPNTVEGSTVDINAVNGVMVDGANVITADIETSNGVIHVIDKVIMP
jgi:uncharacterized surface protein with fasciclin (FAS1) repeats|tara:strand:+ start:17190 stop:17849 length:660 start_codon:yes stop_codon:yes gene_type:complete